MFKDVIHTPANDSFDPRRTPQAQGLLSSRECFMQLSTNGIELNPGTLAFA